jgi:hypothetical protein
MAVVPPTATQNQQQDDDQYQHADSPLLVEQLFNLADFLLDLACELFDLAFGLQVGIVRYLACFLFDCAFHFMKLASNLILRARFHPVSPTRDSLRSGQAKVTLAAPEDVRDTRSPPRTEKWRAWRGETMAQFLNERSGHP